MAINTGNFIGHYGGPEWTPYAEAIAANYSHVVPFFLNVPTTFTGLTNEERIVTTQPWKYDTLIFGANINGCINTTGGADIVLTEDGDTVISEDGDTIVTEGGESSVSDCDGAQIFLQVSDQRTQQTWATISPLGAAPLSAYGGARNNVMPILKLPEVFFLPANTPLRHDWKTFAMPQVGGQITWIGVQLIGPKNAQAPKTVEMPDGSIIAVGSRIPWLSVIGIGFEFLTSGILRYQLTNGRRCLGYTQPAECDVEIHDITTQFFQNYEASAGAGAANDIQFELSDTGRRQFWSQSFAPAPAVMGDITKAFPGLPFCKPYLLKAGRQIELSEINNNVGFAVPNGYIILRGVKLCGL